MGVVSTELQSKLERESATREEAVFRAEAAEHQCSMLGLDLKTTHAELQQTKQDLTEALTKVSISKTALLCIIASGDKEILYKLGGRGCLCCRYVVGCALFGVFASGDKGIFYLGGGGGWRVSVGMLWGVHYLGYLHLVIRGSYIWGGGVEGFCRYVVGCALFGVFASGDRGSYIWGLEGFCRYVVGCALFGVFASGDRGYYIWGLEGFCRYVVGCALFGVFASGDRGYYIWGLEGFCRYVVGCALFGVFVSGDKGILCLGAGGFCRYIVGCALFGVCIW